MDITRFVILPTGHWLFQGRLPVLVTEGPTRGTVYQLICIRRLVIDSFGNI